SIRRRAQHGEGPDPPGRVPHHADIANAHTKVLDTRKEDGLVPPSTTDARENPLSHDVRLTRSPSSARPSQAPARPGPARPTVRGAQRRDAPADVDVALCVPSRGRSPAARGVATSATVGRRAQPSPAPPPVAE